MIQFMKTIFRKAILVFSLVLIILQNLANNALNGVKYFNKTTYKAESHNWCVSRASNGLVYFANHKGLVEFNGTNWQLYNLPNQSITRAVKNLGDTIIFTSGYMELGYWKHDGFGSLSYTSLTPKAKQYFSKNIEFWNIAAIDSVVYFHSFTRILSYRNDSVSPVILPGFVTVMNRVGNKILAAVQDDGIYSIENGVAKSFISGELFKGKSIRFIIPYKKNQILIGTASHGIFITEGTKVEQWKPEWNNYFISNELNRGFYSADGKLILGTLIDGIVVFDENENLTSKINANNGLSNNTVLGIETDEWNNIWLALDDGIGFVSNKTWNSYRIENIPGIGAIYTTAVLNDILYLGTNQGLYAKDARKNEPPVFISGTQGQIWDCKIIDGQLWAGHNQGTFLVNGYTATKINRKSGGFSIRRDPKNENTLIQCTYSDLVAYKKTGKTFEGKNIAGFYDLIRYIEIDHLGNIWASHMHLGIYKIITDDNREKVSSVTYYGENVFGKDFSIHVFKIENRIVFTTNNIIYTYDDLHDTIVPYQNLNSKIGKFSTAHRIVEAPDHHYWFIADKSIGLFRIDNENISLIREFPASVFINTSMVDGFENILPLSETKAILCLQDGYAVLDALVNDSLSEMRNYEPITRKIQLYTNRGKTELMPLEQAKRKIKYNFHNIVFHYSFPFVNDLPVVYKYRLKGLGSDWSAAVQNPVFRFDRLPEGRYILEVKAVDIWGNESKIHSTAFEIQPPAYASPYALFAYFLMFTAVLFGFRSWGIRQTRKKEQLQHEMREKELIRLRNEKLRDEIQHKSKELANSTMSLVKKNEFLLDLKKTLFNQKNELGSRYPDKYYNHLLGKIEENISNHDDWQLFETNFERAHDQFYLKLKETYPNLTPSDLRLCAFLRMNLSSKEIAPLLGISVRGVENHRYKLRKKLNLEHDEILTDTILSI